MKVNIPTSIGELFDKITILEIKKERIDDSKKKIEINKELNLLTKIVKKKKLKTRKLSTYIKKLKKINTKLWIVEDKLRKMERINKFDNMFILNARNVYQLNDKRSAIKNKISILTESNINEVKSYESY